MQDSMTIHLSDGRNKEIELPKYGEIKLIIRNGKICDMETNNKEKLYQAFQIKTVKIMILFLNEINYSIIYENPYYWHAYCYSIGDV